MTAASHHVTSSAQRRQSPMVEGSTCVWIKGYNDVIELPILDSVGTVGRACAQIKGQCAILQCE